MKSVLISTMPFIFVLFLVGVMVQSVESLSAAIPLATSNERANFLKEKITDGCIFFKMTFHPCSLGCSRFLSADDGYKRCLHCLGLQHAEDTFVDDLCACCGRMSMTSLRSRLSFLKGLTPSAAARSDLSGSSRGRWDIWRSGRSEGHSKSLSVWVCPHGPLTPHAVNDPSGSRVILLVRPKGCPVFQSVRHLRIGCQS